MISRDDCSDGIQGWLADDCIIGRGLVDQEEVNHLCDVCWALVESHWQLDGPFCVDIFSFEFIQRHLDQPHGGASHIHLAEYETNKMFVELLVSIKIHKTFPLATFKVTTKAYVWGCIRILASSSIKQMTIFSLLDSLATCSAIIT